MHTTYKSSAIIRSSGIKTKPKGKQDYYTITEISKGGYQIVCYEHLNQVLDYFRNCAMKSNSIKLRFTSKELRIAASKK
jgi:hypothetical protein